MSTGQEEARSGGARAGRAGEAGSGALVLVVDDDMAIRTVARRLLERAGFRVCVAADGREAISVYIERRAEIGAVLIDMSMPRLRGDEVLHELRRLAPEVRAVLMSGFDEPSRVAELTGVGFVAKPWTPQELVAAVQAALE